MGAGAEPLSENIENYLEQILRISKRTGTAKTGEVAEAMHVAPSSVTGMLKRLEKLGFIKYDKYQGAALTDTGYFRALDVLKKHNLAERFLTEIVGMDPERAHDWGCRMEHVLPPELEDWFYRQLIEHDRRTYRP